MESDASNRPTLPDQARSSSLGATLREGPGTSIGPYKILQLIGEGGFGSVFMAQQEQPVQRRVALKIIKLGMDTRQVVARFEQERQALALMDHPNIARVLDAGATETGRPFFVMDLVKGEPIVEYCDRHNLSVEERLDLFVQVCNAVQHAHTKGIIHRDIKPSNILVSMQDGGPSPKVIDFGIAKATSARLTDKTLFTEHRQLIGTPEYMSPEQAEGSLDIDTRTDVYSLGVLLYELLTGTTPFSSESLRAAAHAEIVRIIREVEPPIPSTRLSNSSDTLVTIATRRSSEPRKLGTQIRGDLDWIVMKALEKERTRRYETASGLATDIRRHMCGEAVVAAPPSTVYRVRKFIRRNRVVVSAASAVAGALLVGVAAFAWQAKVAGDQRDKAWKAQKAEAEQRDTAERAAYQAQIVSAAQAVESQRFDAARALLGATSPRLRGWEYRHLESRLDRTLPSPFPPDWTVTWFVTAGSGGPTPSTGEAARVGVRRRASGGPEEWVVLEGDLRTERLTVPNAEAHSFALSPDGTRAVGVPGDLRDAVLWDIATKAPLASLRVDPDRNRDWRPTVTWSVDGERFAIGHTNGYQVHDGRTGALLRSDRAQGTVFFSGDDRWMIIQAGMGDSGRNEFRLLDARTYEPRGEPLRLDAHVNAASCRHSRVACSLENSTLRVLDLDDRGLHERSRIAAGMSNFNEAIAWSPDGRLIAVGSFAGGRVRVWDAGSGELRAEFGGPQSGVVSQLFLPNSDDLCVCEWNGHHRVWPIRTGPGGALTAHKSYVYPAAFAGDGGLLLTGGWDGMMGHGGGLKLWDARAGVLLAEHGKPGEVIISAGMTPDARVAVVGFQALQQSAHRTEVIDLATGAVRVVRHGTTLELPVRTVVHPDGKRVVTSCGPGNTMVWDLATGNVLWQTDQHKRQTELSIISVPAAISPDGRLLAVGDRSLGIRLVDFETHSDIRRWDAHSDGIWTLSFSPDGKWLLSASDDQTVGVWDVATGSLVARLVGHGAKVLCATMSPGGTRIASGGRDAIVRLWDATHFENIAQLGGHTDYIYCLTWSPDGRQLVSTSGDSTVRIWDTRTLAEQLGEASARAETRPRLEALIAKSKDGATDVRAAVEAVIASPELTARERELARQAAARFALGGTPAYYRAARAPAPIVIDGRMDEAAWDAARWSEPFVDIEGDAKPRPRFETRVRMLWDDANLYIAARLEEPHVWGTLSKRDDIVLHDNDFEVFIDPDGDTRNYYEFEINALNAVFDLLLVRTYIDGGPARHDWNLAGLRSAVHVDGTLNDPSDTDRGWTVEFALPWSSLAEHANRPSPPKPGDVWRINFSRVEWQHEVKDGRYVKRPDTKEDNWVWTPQNVVNMHVPGRWGFVDFLGE